MEKLHDYLYEISLENCKYYSKPVFLPSPDSQFHFCKYEEYVQNEKKFHFPVLHRYYSNGYMLNTDGIGEPMGKERSRFVPRCPEEDYPEELTVPTSFPLQMGMTHYKMFTNSELNQNYPHLEKGKGEAKGEIFLCNFSLTYKTSKIYWILWDIEDNTHITIRAFEILLPTYPILYTPVTWQGEKAINDMDKKDIVPIIIEEIKKFKPYLSSKGIEIGSGNDFKYNRREMIKALIRQRKWELNFGG
ncbi:MAG: hypothetical protein WC535_08325 [Candidatus Cloacimonas sp.]|jgi:hypothetical protein